MNILLLLLGWGLNVYIKIKIVELVSAIDDEKETSESEVEVDNTTYQISDFEPVELEREPPRFECDICGKVFNKVQGLRVHVGKVHEGRFTENKIHYFKATSQETSP